MMVAVLNDTTLGNMLTVNVLLFKKIIMYNIKGTKQKQLVLPIGWL